MRFFGRAMTELTPLPSIQALQAYVPGLSIEEIKAKYKLDKVIKLASNENPLGTSPLVLEALHKFADQAFRYPQGGNPRLREALAHLHRISPERIVAGNGSDEIIDLLIRMLALPGRDQVLCFEPCFSIYPIQAQINGVEVKKIPLAENFSFPFEKLLNAVSPETKLVFITTPDNPSGFCPSAFQVRAFAEKLALKNPEALLVIDEAYMDFSPNEKENSLLQQQYFPHNVAYLRTFSKSRGMAGLRLGYGILPEMLADGFWRARLPFSINLLAEEAALAALKDEDFYQKTLECVSSGRKFLTESLRNLGCQVWPSSANFIMFALAPASPSSQEVMESLLRKGVIIRSLKSYALPDYLRVSIGNPEENRFFLEALKESLANEA